MVPNSPRVPNLLLIVPGAFMPTAAANIPPIEFDLLDAPIFHEDLISEYEILVIRINNIDPFSSAFSKILVLSASKSSDFKFPIIY